MGPNASKELGELYPQENGVSTELDTISQQFIIDIARPSKSFEEILNNTKADLANGRFADHIDTSFDYESELCEMVLPHVDQVVVDYNKSGNNLFRVNSNQSNSSLSTSHSKELVQDNRLRPHQTAPVRAPG